MRTYLRENKFAKLSGRKEGRNEGKKEGRKGSFSALNDGVIMKSRRGVMDERRHWPPALRKMRRSLMKSHRQKKPAFVFGV